MKVWVLQPDGQIAWHGDVTDIVVIGGGSISRADQPVKPGSVLITPRFAGFIITGSVPPEPASLPP